MVKKKKEAKWMKDVKKLEEKFDAKLDELIEVVEEIKTLQDKSKNKFSFGFHAGIYGGDHATGESVLGTSSTMGTKTDTLLVLELTKKRLLDTGGMPCGLPSLEELLGEYGH